MPENTAEKLNNNHFTSMERERSRSNFEVRGIWDGIGFVDKVAKERRVAINEEVVLDIHSKVMAHFHPEIAGVYRLHDLEIKGAKIHTSPWNRVRVEMRKFGLDLEANIRSLDLSAPGMAKVLDVAAWSHYRFVAIHPFTDGNGRTARLMTDLIFKRSGLPYLTDWGSKDYEYIDTLIRINETNDISHLTSFFARKLDRRYEQIAMFLMKQSRERIDNSPVIREIRQRQEVLKSLYSPKRTQDSYQTAARVS